MKDSQNITSAQVAEMQQLAEAWATEKSDEIHRKASKQASDIVCSAYHDAKLRLRRHFKSDRQHSNQQIASAEATLKTRERQEMQQLQLKVLHKAQAALKNELINRWQQGEQRSQWVESIWQQADGSLPRAQWSIVYGGLWPQSEQDALMKRVSEETGITADITHDDRIDAGLRICSQGACVDGTVGGLLANHSRLESDILSAFHQFCSGNGASDHE